MVFAKDNFSTPGSPFEAMSEVTGEMAEAMLPEKPAEAGSVLFGGGNLGLKPQATLAPSVLKHAEHGLRVGEMTRVW